MKLFSYALFSVLLFFAAFTPAERMYNDFSFLSDTLRSFSDKDFILIPAGSFVMGCDTCDADERPAHKVTLGSFYISKYEVTQKQWREVMGSNPSYFKGDNLPVEKVSYNDVELFLKKLNEKTGKHYRLPTEAEWEYAARGGAQSKGYLYSGSNTFTTTAVCRENSNGKTAVCGSKLPNELGLYDMSGNVWEWCSDRYDSTYYSSSPAQNPQGPEKGTTRVLRGGSWRHTGAGFCLITNRFHLSTDTRMNNVGVRLVRGE